MGNLVLIAMCSIISATICVMVTSVSTAMGESAAARQALNAIAQQPDEASEISKTLFISMSMVESSSIYGLLIAMVLIFANPFWNHLIKVIQ